MYHNAGPGNPQRGNILEWEQPLTDRLRGEPLTIDARMEPQSILYRTLLLFGRLVVAVVDDVCSRSLANCYGPATQASSWRRAEKGRAGEKAGRAALPLLRLSCPA